MSETAEKTMTSMAISVQTRDRIAAIGAKGDTYEDIILRLLNFYLEKKKKD